MIERIVSLLIGYVFGSVNLTYILGKRLGIDIRTKGSGNLGTTNAIRVIGLKKGIFVLAFDMAKAMIACILVILLFGSKDNELKIIYTSYAALGTILGHCFPFYLNFKGGKGVASILGAMCILDIRVVPIALAIFIGLVLLKKYVSLGSVCGVASTPIIMLIFYFIGLISISFGRFIEYFIIVLIMSSLIIVKHGSNIKRLINGTENKLEMRSKK